jgi:hypothetical protein
LYDVARTTLARHREHVAPTSRKFAVIEGTDGPSGPPDPLTEAFALAEHARTPRERLRGLEAIRAATKLALRGRTDLASEDRLLLDGNIEAAIAAFRDASDFETRARALAGWREALLQRLDATGNPEPIDVPLTVTIDGTQTGGGGPVRLAPAVYWRGVPQRFRDRSRYAVARTVRLTWEGKDPKPDVLKVYDNAEALVWTSP